MSATRRSEPFSRSSTMATLAVVTLVVGTILIGVAYWSNQQADGTPEVAQQQTGDSETRETEAGETAAVAEAPTGIDNASLAGDARPEGPRTASIAKQENGDNASLFAGAPEPPALLPHEASRPESPTLPRPQLNLNAPLASGPRDIVIEGPLLNGPRLDEPATDVPTEAQANYEVEAPDEPQDNEPQTERASLYETLAESPQFRTFARLVQAAEFDNILHEGGPYTIFAPTDEAFNALPRDQVEALLRPAALGQLKSLLAYHIVHGEQRPSELANRRYLPTVNGQRLTVRLEGSELFLDGSRLSGAGQTTANGLIHPIDRLLLPVGDDLSGVLHTLSDADELEFGTFRELLASADLEESLLGSREERTLFAPTDEAFEQLPAETLARLVQPENKQLLAEVLKHHVVAGRHYSQDLLDGQPPVSLADAPLMAPGRSLRAGSAGAGENPLFARMDLESTNGVIHAVNRVLLPPAIETTLLKPTTDPGAVREDAPADESTVARWRREIELAVEDGREQFNAGNPAACAVTFERAIQKLVQSTPPEELSAARNRLFDALNESDRSTTAADQAWALRRGLEDVYGMLFE